MKHDKLENRTIISGGNFLDSKCSFDFMNLSNDTKPSLFIWRSVGDDDRVFFKYTLSLSNGNPFEDCCWNYAKIPLMTFEELRIWKKPRKFCLKINIGIYSGTHGTKWEWQNIFTDPEDFFPLCSPPTFHSNCMDALKISRMFSDVTLLCTDNISIPAHKCILIGSPYFKALFGWKECQRVVEVECDFDSMYCILSFLYSGRIEEDNVVNWPNLFQAASYFQLETLSRHCELQMMTRLNKSLDEIKVLLKFSVKFHANELHNSLVAFIKMIQDTSS